MGDQTQTDLDCRVKAFNEHHFFTVENRGNFVHEGSDFDSHLPGEKCQCLRVYCYARAYSDFPFVLRARNALSFLTSCSALEIQYDQVSYSSPIANYCRREWCGGLESLALMLPGGPLSLVRNFLSEWRFNYDAMLRFLRDAFQPANCPGGNADGGSGSCRISRINFQSLRNVWIMQVYEYLLLGFAA